ncbi:hypothetical protein E2C01_034610 [Portunus trituberculatus]|uniref:Uncharacterized protein n=1 Tax=Portunus trituberculatus TaxID=210409 RepID=A0A5B7F114_PORTR|nr:hypothetical protein [Portunus trituberculatus]
MADSLADDCNPSSTLEISPPTPAADDNESLEPRGSMEYLCKLSPASLRLPDAEKERRERLRKRDVNSSPKKNNCLRTKCIALLDRNQSVNDEKFLVFLFARKTWISSNCGRRLVNVSRESSSFDDQRMTALSAVSKRYI